MCGGVVADSSEVGATKDRRPFACPPMACGVKNICSGAQGRFCGVRAIIPPCLSMSRRHAPYASAAGLRCLSMMNGTHLSANSLEHFSEHCPPPPPPPPGLGVEAGLGPPDPFSRAMRSVSSHLRACVRRARAR